MSLDHTKLDVYHCALELLDCLDRIIEGLPTGRAHLKDQLDRAGTSIVLNIAEGAGEYSSGDKQRFYRMAKRSATETAAVIDILVRRRLVTEDSHRATTALVVRVVSMLTGLVAPRSGRGKGTGRGTGQGG
jgi:four helix bundle protein